MISIHAPARGATGLSKGCSFSSNDFNPRTRKGCDYDLAIDYSCQREFQSTHPQGVRLFIMVDMKSIVTFQSTHPQGVRLYFHKFLNSVNNFNPRTRKGCDEDKYSIQHKGGRISIHAPARGATVI